VHSVVVRYTRFDGIRHGRQLLGGDRLEDRRVLSVARELRGLLPEKYSPLRANGIGLQSVPGRSRPAVRRVCSSLDVPPSTRRSDEARSSEASLSGILYASGARENSKPEQGYFVDGEMRENGSR
jgi:hypothetical protein